MGVSLRVSPTPGQAHSSSPLSQSDEECLANSILRQTACTDTSQTAPWSIYPTGNWGVENTMGEAVCSRAGKRALPLLPVTAYLGGEAVGEWRAWSGSWESRCWMQTYILATISNAPTSFALRTVMSPLLPDFSNDAWRNQGLSNNGGSLWRNPLLTFSLSA